MTREERCTCCDRPLAPRKIVWLELDQRYYADGCVYHDFGGVPEERSQGEFPFGPGCARKKCSEARAAIAKTDARKPT